MAKFDPFLSLDCATVEDVGRNPRKGRDQILQRSVAERSRSPEARRAKHQQSKNLAIAIWQPCQGGEVLPNVTRERHTTFYNLIRQLDAFLNQDLMRVENSRTFPLYKSVAHLF